MKKFMGSRKQKSNLVGGHIMQTMLWDAAKIVEKNIGSRNVTYFRAQHI